MPYVVIITNSWGDDIQVIECETRDAGWIKIGALISKETESLINKSDVKIYVDGDAWKTTLHFVHIDEYIYYTISKASSPKK